jgi:hypothetical protein
VLMTIPFTEVIGKRTAPRTQQQRSAENKPQMAVRPAWLQSDFDTLRANVQSTNHLRAIVRDQIRTAYETLGETRALLKLISTLGH